MKGAIPPAATDDAMAGVRSTSLRLGVRKEKRSLMVGAGAGGGMSWAEAVGEGSGISETFCLILIDDKDEFEERREERMDGSALWDIDGSWLFIAVWDDEQVVLCRECTKEKRKLAEGQTRSHFCCLGWGTFPIVHLHCLFVFSRTKTISSPLRNHISGTKVLHNNRQQCAHCGNYATYMGQSVCVHIHM